MSLHLPAARVARLQARWRPRGVTLNDIFCSALCRAVVLAFPEANARRSHAWLLVTGDLRRSLPDDVDPSHLPPAHLGRIGSSPSVDDIDEGGNGFDELLIGGYHNDEGGPEAGKAYPFHSPWPSSERALAEQVPATNPSPASSPSSP